MYSRFDRLIKERGLKPSDVSKATGISNSTLTDWKKGRYTPKADKLQKIAEYLNVTTDYLIDGSDGGRSFNQEFTAQLAFEGYLRSIGWKVSFVNMSEGMPCDKCDEINRNAPQTDESPFGKTMRLCERCARDDSYYSFTNGTVIFNASPDEYSELEKDAYNLCASWIKDKVNASLSESFVRVAAHDNKATLPKINEDGEVLGGAMKKRDERQK